MIGGGFGMSNPDPTPLHSGRGQETEIIALKTQVERLLFITEALWRILREKHGLEEGDLAKQMAIIDLEDGRLDGRKPPTLAQPCPKCQRMLSKERPTCLYCGEPITLDPFAR